MCFSATASFTAASALIPIGACTTAITARKRRWSFLLLALVPLAFGLQQITEGFVWLRVNGGDLASARAWSLGFLFFSHFFWPFFVPLMAYSAEEQPKRRKLLGGLAILGFIFGLVSYVPFQLEGMWFNPIVNNCHIDYTTTVLLGPLPTRIIYAAIVLAALFGSTHRSIKIFGAIAAASIAVTAIFWGYVFISVWCFFAAVLSIYMLYVVWRLPSA